MTFGASDESSAGTPEDGESGTDDSPADTDAESADTDSTDTDSTDTDSADTGQPCTETTPGPPTDESYAFELGGQLAWSHDAGSPAGWFHTYDALDLGLPGPETPVSAPHKVHLLLPRDYDACGPGYPVVYMNDGSSSFWQGGSANKTWDVPGALSSLYAEGLLDAVIVVAVEPNDRDYEYSHTPWTGDLDPETCCAVEDYADYLADDLRAFVDAHYNTLGDPEHTAIVGSSRGGLGAFFVANDRPDVFGHAGCMSSSFWLGLDPVFGGDFEGGALADSLLVALLGETLADPDVRPQLWIDWGLIRTGGFHNEVIEEAATTRGIEMVGLLEQEYGYALGEALFGFEDPEGEHDEDSWGRRFPDVMLAFFE
nr:alpha/beta hydrolase-fold protein [Pseudenhygromyxa sp. WMMC2535]